MIVLKKPFWMRKGAYLERLVKTFMNQIPDIFRYGKYTVIQPRILIYIYMKLEQAYPDRVLLQAAIDDCSETLLMVARDLKEIEDNESRDLFKGQHARSG